MNYNKIIDNAIENTKTEFDYLTIVEKSVGRKKSRSKSK